MAKIFKALPEKGEDRISPKCRPKQTLNEYFY